MKRMLIILLLIPATLQAGAIKPVRGTQLDYSHPLCRGLVGAWMLNEAGGSKVYDLMGNNTGTLTNATFADCKYGVGVDFEDSTGDKITTTFPAGSTLYVSLWVQFDALGTAKVLFSWSSNQYMMLYRDRWNIYAGGTGLDIWPTYPAPVIGTWHHVVVGFYESTYASLWVDGRKVGTDVSFTAMSSGTFYIGGDAGSLHSIDGRIDHLLIYNRLLSDSEIRTLYREPFAVFGNRAGFRGSVSGTTPAKPRTHTIVIGSLNKGGRIVSILCVLFLLCRYKVRHCYIVILLITCSAYGSVIPVESGGTAKTGWTQYCIPWLSENVVFGEIPIGNPGQYLQVIPDWGNRGYQWDTLTTDDVTEGANLYSTLANIQAACGNNFHAIGGTDRGVPNPLEWTEYQLESSLSDSYNVLTNEDTYIEFSDMTVYSEDDFDVETDDDMTFDAAGTIKVDAAVEAYLIADDIFIDAADDVLLTFGNDDSVTFDAGAHQIDIEAQNVTNTGSYTTSNDFIANGGADSHIYIRNGATEWLDIDGSGGPDITIDVDAGNLTLSDDGITLTLDQLNTAHAHVTANGSSHSFIDQDVTTSGTPTFATVDTGQGANELYDMDQNVLTTSTPQFANLGVGAAAAANLLVNASGSSSNQYLAAGLYGGMTGTYGDGTQYGIYGLAFSGKWTPASPAAARTCTAIFGANITASLGTEASEDQDLTVTSAYGVKAGVSSKLGATPDGGSATISSAYTFYGTKPDEIDNGVITTAYGLYLEASTEAGTNYAIYTAGATTDSYLEGDISAEDVTDRTPAWEGTQSEALKAVTDVKSIDGKIDHNSLPEFARRTVYAQKPTGKIINEYDRYGNIIGERPETEAVAVDGRSLGAMISIYGEAIKELTARIESLEAEVDKLKGE